MRRKIAFAIVAVVFVAAILSTLVIPTPWTLADVQAANGPAESGILWRYDVPEGGSFNPVAAEGGITYLALFLPDSGGSLLAIDRSGAEIWSFYVGSSIGDLVVGVDGTAYIIGADDDVGHPFIHALTPEGELLWSFDISAELPNIEEGIFPSYMSSGPDGGVLFILGDTYYQATANSTFYACSVDRHGELSWCTELMGRFAIPGSAPELWTGTWIVTPERMYVLTSSGSVEQTLDLKSMGLNAGTVPPTVSSEGVLYTFFVNSTRTYPGTIATYEDFETPFLMAFSPNGSRLWEVAPLEAFGYVKSTYMRIVGTNAEGALIVQTFSGSQVNESCHAEWLLNGSNIVAAVPGMLFEVSPDGTMRKIAELPLSYAGQIGSDPWIVMIDQSLFLIWNYRIDVRDLNGTIVAGVDYNSGRSVAAAGTSGHGMLYTIYGAGSMGGGTLFASSGAPCDLGSTEDKAGLPGTEAVTAVTALMAIMLVSASSVYLALVWRRK